MAIKQISILMENKTGAIHEVISFLANNDVDIRAVNMADTPNFGILRVIVNNPENVKELLEKEGYVVSICNVLAIGLEDTPGGLSKVSGILYRNGISLEYVYAFVSNSDTYACVIIHTTDIKFTEKILKEENIPMYDESIYSK